MAIIQKLGEGYYGVETEGTSIDPVVFERMSKAFESATARVMGAAKGSSFVLNSSEHDSSRPDMEKSLARSTR